jgi:transcription termination factor Rho
MNSRRRPGKDARHSHKRSGQGGHPAHRHHDHRGRGGQRRHRHGDTPEHRPAPVPEREERIQAPSGDAVQAEGVLELHAKGYGFLRSPAKNYLVQPADAYVSGALISRFHLQAGHLVGGLAEPGRNGEGPRLASVDFIEGRDAAAFKPRDFETLTPVDPHQWLRLETGPEPLTTRVMDLLTPIGKGQRGLIVAPPRTGKTILLQHVAQAVIANHPEMHLIMLLIDERPEEVTDMRRKVKGEVLASSSDRDVIQHIRLAELAVERAKRLTEQGRDVFVLLDSLTRLARAYNKQNASGRTMTGGIDIRALEVPKRLFGTARVFEEGGSLTVLGTCLIDTGSRMDDIIFQEFKGTGNMELVLDRKLSDRRVFPALDISQSGTRKEELLLPPDTLKRVTLLRRSLVSLNPVGAMEGLVMQLGKHESNASFLERVGTFVR